MGLGTMIARHKVITGFIIVVFYGKINFPHSLDISQLIACLW